MDADFALDYAVRMGDLKKVKELVQHYGLSYSKRWLGGHALLCDALEFRNNAVAKYLLNIGCKIKISEKYPRSPLHLAVHGGDVDIIETILDCEADVDVVDEDGNTPLHVAIEYRQEDVVELLLMYGAKLDLKDENGQYPIHIAANQDYIQILVLVVQYGAVVDQLDDNGDTALLLAVEQGFYQNVEFLIKCKASKDIPSNHNAFKLSLIKHNEGYQEIAQIFLDHGFYIKQTDADDAALLHGLVNNGYFKIFRDLMDYGASIDARYGGRTLLHAAVISSRMDFIEFLVDHKADLNARDIDDKTPLHFLIDEIVVSPHANEIAQLLLTNGANVNAQDEDGITILHKASNGRDKQLLKTLLKYNADVNIKTKYGSTALREAILYADVETVELLVLHGADLNAKVKNGVTYLHVSLEYSRLETTKFLLDHGADVNGTDNYGNTALHLGAILPDLSAMGDDHIELLLDYGADINIRNGTENTALECDPEWEELGSLTLKYHTIKLLEAGLYVSPQNLEVVATWIIKDDIIKECRDDIRRMKKTKISNTNISYYDFYMKSISSLASLLRNEKVVRAMKGRGHEFMFPIYYKSIEYKFRRALMRRDLVQHCHKLSNLFFPKLPHNCIEKIFGYLGNLEMKFLIAACARPENNI